jgi:hypothetical protein
MLLTCVPVSKARLMLASFVAFLMAGCLGVDDPGPPPTDNDISSRFLASESDFKALVVMSQEDYANSGVTRISVSFTRLKDNWAWPRSASQLGFSESRWNEYRRLFRQLNLPDGLDTQGPENEMIMFEFWGAGLADNSRSRGVLYSIHAVRPDSSASSRFLVRPLRDNWYIYEWYTW